LYTGFLANSPPSTGGRLGAEKSTENNTEAALLRKQVNMDPTISSMTDERKICQYFSSSFGSSSSLLTALSDAVSAVLS